MKPQDGLDYEGWALDLSTLLDAIEAVADDEEAVRALCYARFSTARRHGLTVHWLGPGNIGHA